MAREIRTIGFKELRKAVHKNPRRVKSEAKRYLTRGMREYKAGIIRKPWRLGMSGGGAPVDTGNLRDTHRTRIQGFEAAIYPTAKYDKEVYFGRRGMQPRPWLEYVERTSKPRIIELQNDLLRNIVKDLAK